MVTIGRKDKIYVYIKGRGFVLSMILPSVGNTINLWGIDYQVTEDMGTIPSENGENHLFMLVEVLEVAELPTNFEEGNEV